MSTYYTILISDFMMLEILNNVYLIIFWTYSSEFSFNFFFFSFLPLYFIFSPLRDDYFFILSLISMIMIRIIIFIKNLSYVIFQLQKLCQAIQILTILLATRSQSSIAPRKVLITRTNKWRRSPMPLLRTVVEKENNKVVGSRHKWSTIR